MIQPTHPSHAISCPEVKRKREDRGEAPRKFRRVGGSWRGDPPHAIPFGEVTPFMNRPNNTRKYTSSYSNATISRGNLIRNVLEESGPKFLHNTEENPRLTTPESLHLRDRVVDHAYRRIQLFYYLCLIYYQENLTVERASTSIQHGVGPYYGVAAAHSCILPNVTDDFWPHLRRLVESRGVTHPVQARLIALGWSRQDILRLKLDLAFAKIRLDTVDLSKRLPDQGALVAGDSYFYQAMNSTVVLPTYVNKFDMCIEAVMRPEALRLLNQVSFGVLSPYAATELFVQKINEFLVESEAQAAEKLGVLDSLYRQERVLCQAEVDLKAVKLTDANHCHQVLSHYLLAAHDLNQTLRRLKSMNKSVGLGPQLKKRHLPVAKVMEPAKAWLKGSRESLKKDLEGPLKEFTQVTRHLLTKMREAANSRPWCPWSLGWIRTMAENALEVVRLQRQGSVLPPEEMLSGVSEHGTRRLMNEDELFDQKMELIRRVPVVHYVDDDYVRESLFPTDQFIPGEGQPNGDNPKPC